MDETNQSLEDFLYFEAKERAFEIEIKGLKEFEAEKARITDKGNEAIREDFEKKLKAKEIEKKIEKSGKINGARLQKMSARNTIMSKIMDEAEVVMAKKIESDESYYKALMKKLIVQAFIKMLEKKVLIRCLERDFKMVKALLPSCVTEFKDFIKKELDIEWKLDAEVDEANPLEYRNVIDEDEHKDVFNTRRIHKSEEDKKCLGGILALNADKSITCKNTIDTRLVLCYQESLPDIRRQLFPQ